MGPAEKHNMSYQTPIFPFLPPHRLSISLQLSITWNTGRDKALWSCGSDGRTSSPAASGTCTRTHIHTLTHKDAHASKSSSLAYFLLSVSQISVTQTHTAHFWCIHSVHLKQKYCNLRQPFQSCRRSLIVKRLIINTLKAFSEQLCIFCVTNVSTCSLCSQFGPPSLFYNPVFTVGWVMVTKQWDHRSCEILKSHWKTDCCLIDA